MERVALQAVMVMPSLLLQRPHVKAGSKEFSQHLTRCLSLWKAGKIKELLEEARTIQSRLPKLDMERGTTTSKLNRRFTALISKGEVHAAISLITEHGKGEVGGSTRSHSRGTSTPKQNLLIQTCCYKEKLPQSTP